MSGVCQINIVEPAQTLKALLGQQKTASGKERVQALYLLKTRQVETVQGLAVSLGRDLRFALLASLSRYSTTLVTPISSRWTQGTVNGREKQRKTESHSRLGN